MADYGNYSISKCLVAQLIKVMAISCGCVPHYDTMQPNDTSICTPAHIYACYDKGFVGAMALPVPDDHQQRKPLVSAYSLSSQCYIEEGIVALDDISQHSGFDSLRDQQFVFLSNSF